jgi:hypothetical protein
VTGEIAQPEDTEALVASSPFISEVATPEDAARDVVDEVLAGEPYIVTHGHLLEPVSEHHDLILKAVERAGERSLPGPPAS